MTHIFAHQHLIAARYFKTNILPSAARHIKAGLHPTDLTLAAMHFLTETIDAFCHHNGLTQQEQRATYRGASAAIVTPHYH